MVREHYEGSGDGKTVHSSTGKFRSVRPPEEEKRGERSRESRGKRGEGKSLGRLEKCKRLRRIWFEASN